MTRHNDIPWDAASCASVGGGNMWFPLAKQRTLIAKLERICATCPIKTMCHDYAVEHDLLGYWGGELFLTASELAFVSRPKGQRNGEHNEGVHPGSHGGPMPDMQRASA